MRKLIWTITALGLLATAPATNAANASKEESIGVGTGNTIGDLSNLINNPSAEGLLTAVKTFPSHSPPP